MLANNALMKTKTYVGQGPMHFLTRARPFRIALFANRAAPSTRNASPRRHVWHGVNALVWPVNFWYQIRRRRQVNYGQLPGRSLPHCAA